LADLLLLPGGTKKNAAASTAIATMAPRIPAAFSDSIFLSLRALYHIFRFKNDLENRLLPLSSSSALPPATTSEDQSTGPYPRGAMLDRFSAIDATLQQGAAHCRIEAGQMRSLIAIADRGGETD
jgi:hypothetical protein